MLRLHQFRDHSRLCSYMIPPLTRAVCHLSIACLLSTRPVRCTGFSAAHHRSFPRKENTSLVHSEQARQTLYTRRSHQPVRAMQTQAWQYPKPLTFPAKSKHTATVIILHGLGDTGRGWSDFGPMLQASMPHVKFIFPTAPTVHHTCAGWASLLLKACI